MRSRRARVSLVKTVLVAVCGFAFGLSCLQPERKLPVTLTSAETPPPLPVRASQSSFKEFDHAIQEHKQFDCTSCHRREGSSLKMDFAAHEACIGCHMNQFAAAGGETAATAPPAMCSICHQDTRAEDPKMKVFPTTFKEKFNMKFDHAAHETGKGKPAGGCTACHNLRDPGMTIPTGFQAHSDCYSCHTAETKIGSCSTCHALGPYNRTLASEYPLGYIFRHSDHGSRQNLSCNDCHTVVAGAPNARQVRNISILEHKGPGNNCANCHNGRRAFGGNPTDFNFSSCSKCHRNRVTALPPNAVPDS